MRAVTPIALLKPYQRAVIDDASRFICWIAGRQIGKSFTGAMRFVRLAARHPKTDYMIASPSERQSLEAILKCKQHVEGFKEAKIVEELVEAFNAAGAEELQNQNSLQKEIRNGTSGPRLVHRSAFQRMPLSNIPDEKDYSTPDAAKTIPRAGRGRCSQRPARAAKEGEKRYR